MNDKYYHLLANNNFLKKNKKKLTIDDELCMILQRKYQNRNLHINDIQLLVPEIENLIDGLYIQTILYELIDCIE
jgi:hypothetical protein